MLYIICFASKLCRDCDKFGILLGFLPYENIPEGSIVREAIYSGLESIRTGEDGVTGVYQNKELAEEHLRLEKEWRRNDEVWMVIITMPKGDE